MLSLAKSLPEYTAVRAMGGVGEVLAAKLIAEIGDVRRFLHGKSLISYAGIDSPPYQSGQFTAQNRRISKRGSAYLRKIGYEVMQSLKTHGAPADDSVYQFNLKKELEGKSKKAAKIAGMNKFLQIYYARVVKVYRQNQQRFDNHLHQFNSYNFNFDWHFPVILSCITFTFYIQNIFFIY